MASVADLIEYRRHHERLIERTVTVKLPSMFGANFDLHVYRASTDEQPHLAVCLDIPQPVGDTGAPPIQEPNCRKLGTCSCASG